MVRSKAPQIDIAQLPPHPADRPPCLISEQDVFIYDRIAEGNFGMVNRAVFESTLVAVKSFKSKVDIAEAFAEYNQLTRIKRHRNLLPVVGAVIAGNKLSVVTPFLSNGSLEDALRTNPAWGASDHFRLLAAAIDLFSGLEAFHEQGFVHCDGMCRV
jgi:serine/threonine protein kinase